MFMNTDLNAVLTPNHYIKVNSLCFYTEEKKIMV